jgi:hypothetical protein
MLRPPTITEGERERLTDRERQILKHFEQAHSLDVPLTEYASASEVDVRDLYAAKAQLVKKGILARPSDPDKSDINRASATICRNKSRDFLLTRIVWSMPVKFLISPRCARA